MGEHEQRVREDKWYELGRIAAKEEVASRLYWMAKGKMRGYGKADVYEAMAKSLTLEADAQREALKIGYARGRT